MVEMTDELRALWWKRRGQILQDAKREGSISSDWWTGQYEAALSRIKFERKTSDGPSYWSASATEMFAWVGDDTLWDCGWPVSIENARRVAFETLALCDLAEASLPRGGEG